MAVGVMGDAAPTTTPAPSAPSTSTDGMTADYFDLSHDLLGSATRIIKDWR